MQVYLKNYKKKNLKYYFIFKQKNKNSFYSNLTNTSFLLFVESLKKMT